MAVVAISSLGGVAVELQLFAMVDNLPVSVNYVVRPVPRKYVVTRFESKLVLVLLVS